MTVGASLMAVTVRLAVLASVAVLSLTSKLNATAPFQSAVGVNVHVPFKLSVRVPFRMSEPG